jgi:hypothetical protein
MWFEAACRVWRKLALFTLVVELYFALVQEKEELQPSNVVQALTAFFSEIDAGQSMGAFAGIYYKAALQASNDRVNRVRAV